VTASSFKTGGPLEEKDRSVYVVRRADAAIRDHLGSMDYVLLIEPRQQGKTSLISRLMGWSPLDGYIIVYHHFNIMSDQDESIWYRELGHHILKQLADGGAQVDIPLPESSNEWRRFLEAVAVDITKKKRQRLVLALDEIAAVPAVLAEAFFSVLRDVYNSRIAERQFGNLTFVLAGVYNPRDLIRDDRISPFNVAQRVRLQDFSLQEVNTLVACGGWNRPQAARLARQIHYWTSGQPYLTQLVCSHLAPQANVDDVDAAAKLVCDQDTGYLGKVLEQSLGDEESAEYLSRILAGEQIGYWPTENRLQARLELSGGIKRSHDGFCVVRNRICEQMFLRAGFASCQTKSTRTRKNPLNWKADSGADECEERPTVNSSSGVVRMTATEAARYVGISAKTMRRWIVNHKLIAIDVGDYNYEFRKEELDAHRRIHEGSKRDETNES